MERENALVKLKLLEGKDIRHLANEYDVTVWKDGKKNKGWFGHTLERYLGIPMNSAQSPNFGSWELKTVSFKKLKQNDVLKAKETMAITMIDPYHVERTPFEESHLLAKLKKAVICSRLFEAQEDTQAILLKVMTFDLGDKEIYQQIRDDYEETRLVIKEKGFAALTGKMGVLVQPRTKGAGHGSVSRAFYARAPFVTKIFESEE